MTRWLSVTVELLSTVTPTASSDGCWQLS